MSYSYWTQDEIDTLIRMWPDHSLKEIAAAVGRSRSGVQGKAFNLNLPSKLDRPYTTADDRFIIENRERMTNKEIAYHLGRNEKSITSHIALLKLPHKRCRRDVLIDELAQKIGTPVHEKLRELRNQHTRKQLARLLECEFSTLGQVIVYFDGMHRK